MDRIKSGKSLAVGEKLTSRNGYHVLAFQKDSNLVLYSLGRAVWQSNTKDLGGERLTMQEDGNLVIYNTNSKSIWSTGQDGRGSSKLVMQNDRNAVTYTSENVPTWQTSTFTPLELYNDTSFEANPDLLAAMEADADYLWVILSITCSVTPAGVLVCVGAMVLVAVILEFANGNPAFGPNSAPRVIGGQLSDASKKAGKDISNWAKGRGSAIADVFDRWF